MGFFEKVFSANRHPKARVTLLLQHFYYNSVQCWKLVDASFHIIIYGMSYKTNHVLNEKVGLVPLLKDR